MAGKIREIKLSPSIGENDMDYRVKWAEDWIKDGDQVKCTMVFKGRQMKFKHIGQKTLLFFIAKVSGFAVPIAPPKDIGRNIVCTLKKK